ncbi:acid-sensing ion channel 4-like [Acanthaster planci]|uniref:Acid-sensing ion channel 4-like n=1 Tax=Acanthaster planci TaxID=133434 RepID=A0A8B7XHM3_ACAPL|nr:acid-sensing ion channel 4-like [Acanthaster planci]
MILDSEARPGSDRGAGNYRQGISLTMMTEATAGGTSPSGTASTTEQPSEECENSSLKERIATFGDETTFHGVRFVTNHQLHFLRRLLWFCIVGGMTGYLIYGVSVSFITFYQRPVTSVVKINYVRQIPFPTVTFCNYNQWKKSRVPPEFYDAVRSLNPANKKPVDMTYLKAHDVTNLTDKLINDTHQIEDMLLECTFKEANCSAENFTQIITDFGVCYSFNDDPSNVHYVHQSGSQNALFMKITVEQEEYIFGENNAAGIKLLVHPQCQRPLVKELGIAVSPGFETLVSVQLKQVVNLKYPYESNCTDRGNVKYSAEYTVPLCQYEHKIETVKAKCGCKDMRYPGSENECPLSKYSNCLLPAEANFTSEDKSFNCPVPCDLTIYDTRMSFAYYPGQHHLEEIMQQNNLSENSIRKNVLDLRIFFEELSFQKIEEIPSYTFYSLQSSIGGYMGLLIGASLITLFEFLDFILVTTTSCLLKHSVLARPRGNRVRGAARQRDRSSHGEAKPCFIKK